MASSSGVANDPVAECIATEFREVIDTISSDDDMEQEMTADNLQKAFIMCDRKLSATKLRAASYSNELQKANAEIAMLTLRRSEIKKGN